MCPWTLQDTYYTRPHYQEMESQQLYLIHSNKHREAATMRGQRNMVEKKEQVKSPEKKLNEMEISNHSDAGFKSLFIQMLYKVSEDLHSIIKSSKK